MKQGSEGHLQSREHRGRVDKSEHRKKKKSEVREGHSQAREHGGWDSVRTCNEGKLVRGTHILASVEK
jgi:hypothetical protein